jgi:predicted methyltransferase
MRKIILSLVSLGVVGALAGCATAGPAPSSAGEAVVTAALADPARPAADTSRDAKRLPAAMIAFAGIKPGMVVVDLLPGSGYFTRIFSKVVGPGGKVYAAAGPGRDGAPPAVAAIASNPVFANVIVTPLSPAQTFATPEKVDLVWTSRNYHDLRNTTRNLDIAAINKAVYQSLKPGGIFIVLDHAAAPGSGPEIPGTLHRINPDIVKADLKAAGFVLVGESNVLRNPADDVTKRVFEEGIPDSSDQFILKFRKP